MIFLKSFLYSLWLSLFGCCLVLRRLRPCVFSLTGGLCFYYKERLLHVDNDNLGLHGCLQWPSVQWEFYCIASLRVMLWQFNPSFILVLFSDRHRLPSSDVLCFGFSISFLDFSDLDLYCAGCFLSMPSFFSSSYLWCPWS